MKTIRAIALSLFLLPLSACKTLNLQKPIQPESISIQLSPSTEQFGVRYTLVNRNDFPIAVLRSHVPSESGELLDNLFRFEPTGPSFTRPIAQYEWTGDDSVVVIEPSGEYGMSVRLADYYSGLEEGTSVSINNLMQVARAEEGTALHPDSFDLVQARSNDFSLRLSKPVSFKRNAKF
jgi:hypothetical protein